MQTSNNEKAFGSNPKAFPDITNNGPIIPPCPPVVKPTEKDCTTVEARLAIQGRTLQCNRRASDGRRTWHVSGHHGTFVFSHFHDLLAHVTNLENRGRVI